MNNEFHAVASTMDNKTNVANRFKNAFNLVDRKSFINLDKIHFPLLANILIVGSHIHLRSTSRVQQGCRLVSFLFALVLNYLISNIIPPSLKLNKWYFDDAHLDGKTVDILNAGKQEGNETKGRHNMIWLRR
jgi:hypothetical protein